MQQQPKSGQGLIFFGQILTIGVIAFATWILHTDLTRIADRPVPAAAPSNNGNAPSEPELPADVENWESMIRDHNVARGPEDAPVTIIEFSDFECPYCARFYTQAYKQIIAAYGDKVRFYYKHFPLEQIHPNAKLASIGAQCAARENKFWEVHDAVFDQYKELSEAKMVEIGKNLGLSDGYFSCLTNKETAIEVENDMQDGFAASVRGTPTFLINGKVMPGALPFSKFKEEIDKYL